MSGWRVVTFAVPASVTFDGQSFIHLSAQLASALANLPDLPQPSHKGQRTVHSLPISYLFYFFNIFFYAYIIL